VDGRQAAQEEKEQEARTLQRAVESLVDAVVRIGHDGEVFRFAPGGGIKQEVEGKWFLALDGGVAKVLFDLGSRLTSGVPGVGAAILAVRAVLGLAAAHQRTGRAADGLGCVDRLKLLPLFADLELALPRRHTAWLKLQVWMLHAAAHRVDGRRRRGRLGRLPVPVPRRLPAVGLGLEPVEIERIILTKVDQVDKFPPRDLVLLGR